MPSLFQWGRLLQVDLTLPGGVPIRLVDFDSRRVRDHQGLACDLTFTRHVLPVAQPVTCTVYNMAPLLVDQVYGIVAAARNTSALTQAAVRAGRLVIRAGRDEITMIKVVDDLVTSVDQPSATATGADVATVIEGQDGRLLWDSLYIDTLTPLQGLVKAGALPSPVPPPPLPTYTHGGAGETITLDTQSVIGALGYIPIQRGDATVWVPVGGTMALPVIMLDTVCIPPVPPEGPNGVRRINVMYDSIFMPGMACTLLGRPYAMDEIIPTLSTQDPMGWTASLLLRSTLPV
jgi:hypothetical protein